MVTALNIGTITIMKEDPAGCLIPPPCEDAAKAAICAPGSRSYSQAESASIFICASLLLEG